MASISCTVLGVVCAAGPALGWQQPHLAVPRGEIVAPDIAPTGDGALVVWGARASSGTAAVMAAHANGGEPWQVSAPAENALSAVVAPSLSGPVVVWSPLAGVGLSALALDAAAVPSGDSRFGGRVLDVATDADTVVAAVEAGAHIRVLVRRPGSPWEQRAWIPTTPGAPAAVAASGGRWALAAPAAAWTGLLSDGAPSSWRYRPRRGESVGEWNVAVDAGGVAVAAWTTAREGRYRVHTVEATSGRWRGHRTWPSAGVALSAGVAVETLPAGVGLMWAGSGGVLRATRHLGGGWGDVQRVAPTTCATARPVAELGVSTSRVVGVWSDNGSLVSVSTAPGGRPARPVAISRGLGSLTWVDAVAAPNGPLTVAWRRSPRASGLGEATEVLWAASSAPADVGRGDTVPQARVRVLSAVRRADHVDVRVRLVRPGPASVMWGRDMSRGSVPVPPSRGDHRVRLTSTTPVSSYVTAFDPRHPTCVAAAVVEDNRPATRAGVTH